MPTLKPTLVICSETKGAIDRITFHSEVLEADYRVSVYIPPCYGKTQKADYPVLYLLHGQNMDDRFWPSLGVGDLADTGIAEGAPAFLMVMPQEVLGFDPVLESHFGESIINELIPWVEKTYTVCTERACREIGGISRGGGWAMRLALRNFDVFGAVGAHSMGLMPGDWWQAQKLLKTHSVDEFPRIYMDRGDKDYLADDIDFFENVLTENHIPHEYHINPGVHDVRYWQAHVAEYLDWYIAGFEHPAATPLP